MIEAAILLMRASGLSGAGINEIVRESGAPKGSVYYHFPQGKLQIVRDALTTYSSRVDSFIDTALASRRSPPRKVLALFEAFAARIEEAEYGASCAVGAVSLDLDLSNAELQPLLGGILAHWTTTVARHFDLGTCARSESFARLLMTAVEGAYVASRAERSSRPFREAGTWLARLVE